MELTQGSSDMLAGVVTMSIFILPNHPSLLKYSVMAFRERNTNNLRKTTRLTYENQVI